MDLVWLIVPLDIMPIIPPTRAINAIPPAIPVLACQVPNASPVRLAVGFPAIVAVFLLVQTDNIQAIISATPVLRCVRRAPPPLPVLHAKPSPDYPTT